MLGASRLCTATPTLRGAVPPVDLRAVAVVRGMEYRVEVWDSRGEAIEIDRERATFEQSLKLRQTSADRTHL